MDRDTTHSRWQDLSGKIKGRWDQLSDEEIAHAEGDREYLVGKVHERYGLARDEIDQELQSLGVGAADTAVGPLGSGGYANADNVVPGSALDDQIEAAAYEQSRESSLGNRDAAGGTDFADETGARQEPEPQDVLKDRGSATQSGRAAPLDQPERRRGRQHRS